MRYKCPSAFRNRCVFSVFRKLSALSDGSRRSSGSAFQAIRPATENARRPSVLRRCRGTTRWWRLEDRSRWRLATSDVGCHEVLGSLALETPVICHSELMEDSLRNIEPVQLGVEQMCQALLVRNKVNPFRRKPTYMSPRVKGYTDM